MIQPHKFSPARLPYSVGSLTTGKNPMRKVQANPIILKRRPYVRIIWKEHAHIHKETVLTITMKECFPKRVVITANMLTR